MAHGYGVFCGQMLTQVVYQTNADYFDSREAIVQNQLMVWEATEKGLITFRFANSRTVFLLSPKGTLQVKWNDVSEKRTLFRLIRKLLVAKGDESLVIKPLKQQAWIDYPVPEQFRLYWCDETTEYVLRKDLETKETKDGIQNKIASSAPENGSAKSVGEKVRYVFYEVSDSVEALRRELRFFREPTYNEVAIRSRCRSSNTLSIGLAFAGWKEESEEEAKRTAEEAINLAGWLRFKESHPLNPELIAACNKAIDAASLKGIQRAQDILKNYPVLAPKVNSAALVWSDETNIRWIQAFGCKPPSQQ